LPLSWWGAAAFCHRSLGRAATNAQMWLPCLPSQRAERERRAGGGVARPLGRSLVVVGLGVPRARGRAFRNPLLLCLPCTVRPIPGVCPYQQHAAPLAPHRAALQRLPAPLAPARPSASHAFDRTRGNACSERSVWVGARSTGAGSKRAQCPASVRPSFHGSMRYWSATVGLVGSLVRLSHCLHSARCQGRRQQPSACTGHSLPPSGRPAAHIASHGYDTV
jgi:hypothetical protein